jgi:hypothetical protein
MPLMPEPKFTKIPIEQGHTLVTEPPAPTGKPLPTTPAEHDAVAEETLKGRPLPPFLEGWPYHGKKE